MRHDPSPPISADFDHRGAAYAILSYGIPQNPILRGLTPAELEVLELWLDGASAEEVASLRGCAVRTVNNQVASIYRKLGAGSRAELATMVRSPSVTPPPLASADSGAAVDTAPRRVDSTPPPASHRRPLRNQRTKPSGNQLGPSALSRATTATTATGAVGAPPAAASADQAGR